MTNSSTDSLDRRHFLLGAAAGLVTAPAVIRATLGAVKHPNRQCFQSCSLFRIRQKNRQNITPAADGRDGRELVRMSESEAPRAIATHAEPNQINPLPIDGQFFRDLIQESHENIIRPGLTCWTLRRNHDERKIRLIFDDLRRAMHSYFGNVCAALSGAAVRLSAEGYSGLSGSTRFDGRDNLGNESKARHAVVPLELCSRFYC